MIRLVFRYVRVISEWNKYGFRHNMFVFLFWYLHILCFYGATECQGLEDFAIANVQCQYDGDAEEAPRPLIDHNYDRADEPPAFIIQQVNVSSLPLGGAPLAAPKFMTIAPGALPAVNVIHVADQRQVQEQPQETNMNKRIRRSEEVLKEAADCVSRGLTFQTVSERFNIPISTIRFFMARKGILPRRRRGRHGHISTVSSRSPEPPFHMQHYKLPHMLALAADCDQDNE